MTILFSGSNEEYDYNYWGEDCEVSIYRDDIIETEEPNYENGDKDE